MAKEEKPLEYERRILDTKGLAQRIDLAYLSRPHWFRVWRRRLAWTAAAAVVVVMLPFLIGIGGGKKAFSSGPVSRAHAMFEGNCSLCHTKMFSPVADRDCKKCHDGPIHQANASAEARCAACHVEHRGAFRLADVNDGHCTGCHAKLTAHGTNVRLAATRITAFCPTRHPEFSAAQKPDLRPLRLNHAVHMPAQGKTIRGMKLPMQCSDCHVTDLASAAGDLLPVTFEQHCRSCHKRELEFDVFQLQGERAAPAPHTKDPKTIHDFIAKSYQDLLAANLGIIQQPLGRDLQPARSAATWLDTVVAQSETFLFEKKCTYCHDYEQVRGQFPVVKKVNLIRGQYVENKLDGRSWLEHARFSHRAHRGVTCADCHRAARTSTKTTDVLIPKLENCLPCHGSTGTSQDHCSQCHLYHDKTKERDKDRRPIEQLVGRLSSQLSVFSPEPPANRELITDN